MRIDRVTIDEYKSICNIDNSLFYNTGCFQELNREKADDLACFVFSDTKKKMAISVGIKEREFQIPFSAPFGCFEILRDGIRLEELDEAIDLLEQTAVNTGVESIFFRLPPSFYNQDIISKIQNCLFRKRYDHIVCDLNYSFIIDKNIDYNELLRRNARKNLNHALKSQFSFEVCSDDNIDRVYEIILLNRNRKGFPLKMSLEQVKDTMNLTGHDLFLLHKDGVSVASAIVFQINKTICQVIYWGNTEEFESDRPMNMLASEIYRYYQNQNEVCILDIGPSTDIGIPNYGLCDFKESIGCKVSTKNTFRKKW